MAPTTTKTRNKPSVISMSLRSIESNVDAELYEDRERERERGLV